MLPPPPPFIDHYGTLTLIHPTLIAILGTLLALSVQTSFITVACSIPSSPYGRGHTQIFVYLLERGADSLAVTANGASALHLAATSGRHDICELLADSNGIDIWAPDGDGKEEGIPKPTHVLECVCTCVCAFVYICSLLLHWFDIPTLLLTPRRDRGKTEGFKIYLRRMNALFGNGFVMV